MSKIGASVAAWASVSVPHTGVSGVEGLARLFARLFVGH